MPSPLPRSIAPYGYAAGSTNARSPGPLWRVISQSGTWTALQHRVLQDLQDRLDVLSLTEDDLSALVDRSEWNADAGWTHRDGADKHGFRQAVAAPGYAGRLGSDVALEGDAEIEFTPQILKGHKQAAGSIGTPHGQEDGRLIRGVGKPDPAPRTLPR